MTGFDFVDLLDEAVQRSGGEQSTAEDVIKVRRGLRLLTERWIAQGYNTWRITEHGMRHAGRASHLRLPDDVDDIVTVNARTAGANNYAPLKRISAAEYATIADALHDSRPSQFWLNRTDPPQLYLWPTGAAELKVWYVARPAAFDRHANQDDDVPGRWLEALTAGLALDLARKRPPYDEALIARLKGEAAEAEMLAQRADRDRGRFRYKIGRRR